MRPRLSRDILVYGVGEVVVKAFGLITLPIYTRIFSPEEYGTLSVVLTVAGFILAMVALGGDSAFIRYFMAARTLDERQTVTSTWIGFLAAWSAVAVVLLLPLSGEVARLATGSGSAAGAIAIALLLTPVRLTNLMCAQLLRNEFRAMAYTVLNVVALGLMVTGSVIGAVVLNMGVEGVLLGTLAAELIMIPVRVYSSRHMLRWRFSSTALRQLLAYGVPLVPTSLAYWVFTTSDRVLLSNLSTLEQVGLYSVAASVVNIANIAILAVGQGWNPHAIQAYESDEAWARQLFARMLTYILAGFGLLAVGLTVYATTQVTAGGISLTKRTLWLAMYSWMAALINLALNLILIPPFGMLGAAWATAVAYVFLTLAYGLTSHRLWPFTYDWRRGTTILALTGVALFGSQLLPRADLDEPVMWVLANTVKLTYCAALLTAMFWLGGLDRAELGRLRLGILGREPER